MRIFALLLTVILSSSCTHYAEKTESRSRAIVYESLGETVAITDPEGFTFCSGVVVSKKVVTAAHCLDGEPFAIRYKGRLYPGVVMATWTDKDLAAVMPAGLSPDALDNAISLASSEPYLGEEVYWFGYPNGIELVMGTGTVGKSRSLSDFSRDKMVIFGQVIPGTSGGPVFNRKGELVGIISSTMIARLDPFSPHTLVPVGYVTRLSDLKKVSDI